MSITRLYEVECDLAGCDSVLTHSDFYSDGIESFAQLRDKLKEYG